MDVRLLAITLIAVFLPLHTPAAVALTMDQFSEICRSSPRECSDHPVIQAYVGGALDLLATLDEQTGYLDKVYCKESKVLFDTTAIIRFMAHRSVQYATDNAMLVLVRYFEEFGGCKS